ncbi:hypothetical protein ACIPJS_14475 [Streptomyces sp. NPDC086783]|uniref:hypothetical protein n=1 Tax=Streptomyces sp. NPDC086783 TaxID=3365758 RepID=UPI0037F2C006
MPSPAARTPFELLDLHLEALWYGTDRPLPELDGLATDEDRELVRWALDRLQRIPREPGDDFVRAVGSLLAEFRSRRCAWNAAALRLLDDTYTFAATGPRRNEDWAHDVRAVLHRSVPDPRGWVRLDWDRTNDARDTMPAYPFDPPSAADLPRLVYPVGAETAIGALAVMAEERQAENRPDRDADLADARILLDRYGPTARHWTNATVAGDPAPELVSAGLRGSRTNTFVTSECVNGLYVYADLGLIAVNDEEVGVFWSFEAG